MKFVEKFWRLRRLSNNRDLFCSDHWSLFRREKLNRACKPWCERRARVRVRALTFAGHAGTSTYARARVYKQKRWSDLCSSKRYRRNNVFHLVSQLSCSHESGSIGLFFRVFHGSYLRSCHTWTMKCRVMNRVSTMMHIALVVGVAVVHTSPAEPLPSSLLGNVANTATNFRKSISRYQSLDIAKFYLPFIYV